MLKKYIIRILAGILILNVLFLIVITICSIIYREEIQATILRQINSRLKKKIEIKEITISSIIHFPNITFTLHDVMIPKAGFSGLPLIKLNKIKIVFHAFQILRGNFVVSKIEFSDGAIDLRVYENGLKDFEIWNDSIWLNQSGSSSDMEFSIQELKFNRVNFYYVNKCHPHEIKLSLISVKSSLIKNKQELTVGLKGDILFDEMILKSGTFLKDASLSADLIVKYDFTRKVLMFDKSNITIRKDLFRVGGSVDFMNESLLHLHVNCSNAEVNNVFNILPKKWSSKINAIKLEGNLDVNAMILVALLPDHKPYFDIDFSTKNLSIQKDGLNKHFHNVQFSGNLNSSDQLNVENYVLKLKNVKARIEQSGYIQTKEIYIRNFLNPLLVSDFHLSISCKDLFDIIKFKKYSQVSGRIKLFLKYSGSIGFLSGKIDTIPNMSGTAQLIQVGLKLTELNFPFDTINGSVHFNNDNIYLKNLLVNCGKTDMTIDGSTRNLFHSVYYNTSGLKMNLTFSSKNFYYSDFNFKSQKRTKIIHSKPLLKISEYQISLPYDIRALLKGKIKNFFSKNYQGNQISLNANISSDTIAFNEKMNTFDGQMDVTSIMTPNKSGLDHYTFFLLKNVQVKKVFKAFNDFNQSIVTSDKIDGVLNGVVNVTFKTDANFRMDTSSMNIKGTYTIKNLSLDRVEPIQKLSKLGFKEKDLDHITCENINSEISIQGNQLFIPRTLLVTNILFFYIEDVQMELGGNASVSILLPVGNLKKRPNTNDLTNDSQAGLSLPITISGKPGKMKVELKKSKM